MDSMTALFAAPLPLPSPATGEAQLLPAGTFSARDGRPRDAGAWHLNDEMGLRLATALNAVAAVTPIVIDYEHQTLNAEKNGQPAPAAGWIHSVQWRNGRGLFASVEWTARAKAQITAGEYRYISPVLVYDGNTGEVRGVHNAALVNHPALLGLQLVKANAEFELAPCAAKSSSVLAAEGHALAQRIRAQQHNAAATGQVISTVAAAARLTEYRTALSGEAVTQAQAKAARVAAMTEAQRIAAAAVALQRAQPNLSPAQAVRAVTHT